MYKQEDAFSAWSHETLKSELYIPEDKKEEMDKALGVPNLVKEAEEKSS
jgi:hypothetical protein